MNISRDAYRSISISRNGTANVKYGFAIKYVMDGSTKTLYESTKASLKIW